MVLSMEALEWAMGEQDLLVNYLCGTVHPYFPTELQELQD